jgi:hypothetical protein
MEKLKLNRKLLEEIEDTVSFNTRGLYNSMQFVLRLRPDIYAKLENIPNGIVNSSEIDFETLQAYSTYFHETIHWWQHIGSVTGLIFGLSYPVQVHINHQLLKDYLQFTGKKKSIITYNKLFAKEEHPQDREFQTINQILNNFYDIEHFKILVATPKEVRSVINNPLFECMGHSFHITYSSFISILAGTFDRELKILPNALLWDKEFGRLRKSETEGYYYGSDISLSPIGLKDIFEGQAMFSQIQYLYFATGGKLDWKDFEDLGMLHGVYSTAFEAFLKMTHSEKPERVDDPLVALFLLVCDIAINPMDGFPFDILHFESFIVSVDPGIRFIALCNIIANQHPELKQSIKYYSSDEYKEIAKVICSSMACYSPSEGSERICHWVQEHPSLIKLMEEEKHFTFSKENLPIKVIFSKFVRFQKDKNDNPALFCWPGFHCAGAHVTEEAVKYFGDHQSLFLGKPDGDIYPRILLDKNQDSVYETFNDFYSWIMLYDLCRQWIIRDGEFNYFYFWMTSKYSMNELEKFARKRFESVFGVDPKDFTVVPNHS